MRKVAEPCVNIGHFQILPETCRIKCGSAMIHVEQKCMDVLMLLASRPEEVVSRAAILDAIWPASSSGDQALNRAISNLRKALDDCPDSPSIIETIPGRGYRLIAECRPSHVTFPMQSAEALPWRQRIPRKAAVFAGSVAVLSGGATALLFFDHFTKPQKSGVSLRVLQSPLHVVYVAPTIVISDTGEVHQHPFAQEISSAVHAGLERSNYVIVGADKLVLTEDMTMSRLGHSAFDMGIGRMLGVEIIERQSMLSVHLYILNTGSGTVLWHRTLDHNDPADIQPFLSKIEQTILEETSDYLEYTMDGAQASALPDIPE